MKVKDTVMDINDVALIMFENRGYKSGFAAFCADEEGFLQEGQLIAKAQAEISFKAGYIFALKNTQLRTENVGG